MVWREYRYGQAFLCQSSTLAMGMVYTCIHYSVIVSYYSLYYQQTPLYSRAICRSLPVSCKNAKFTMKLSPTCHAALGRCGEARGEETHLHDLVSSSLVAIYSVYKQSSYT